MTAREDIVEFIPAMRAYARMLTKRHEQADDLVQDTLMKAIANIDRFKPGTNLRAWLYTIMRNSFLNGIERSKRMQTGAEDCISTSVSTPATQEWSLRGKELLEAVANLPPHYREVLVLVVMIGESYETAAEIFDVQIGTIKSRVNRARALVIEQLEARTQNDPLCLSERENIGPMSNS